MILNSNQEEIMKVLWANPRQREAVKKSIFVAFGNLGSEVSVGHLSQVFESLDDRFLPDTEDQETS
jgi:hypothetical protein